MRKNLIIPPFRDHHMHFIVDGRLPTDEELLHIKDSLFQHGIFSVKDMGHKSGIGLKAKNILKEYLDIKSAGYAIYKKGTYGIFLGIGVSDRAEIINAIKYIADKGADFIKVINSGIVCTKGEGLVTEGGFTSEELEIISEESEIRGLKFVCHANSDYAIQNAVNAGASSIEHGFFISKETLNIMAETGVSWTPTVYALLSFASVLISSERGYIDEVIENHLSSINYAASIGVRLNIGTDSGSKGVRHGDSFFEELRLFQNAGLSLEQILSGACMDRSEIERGNYLVVKEDFIEAKKIEAVFVNGKQMF